MQLILLTILFFIRTLTIVYAKQSKNFIVYSKIIFQKIINLFEKISENLFFTMGDASRGFDNSNFSLTPHETGQTSPSSGNDHVQGTNFIF